MTDDRRDHQSWAAKQNPALEKLGRLIGTWQTVGKHPQLPGKTLQGKTTFAWLEGGAFLVRRSTIDAPGFPDGIAIIGSDDARGECFMIYFDEREVSRKYDVQVVETGFVWKREDPKFAQRFTLTVSRDGRTMHEQGLMSRDGGPAEPDLELTYTKRE